MSNPLAYIQSRLGNYGWSDILLEMHFRTSDKRIEGKCMVN
jgi:hypothetical protein